MPPLHSPSGGRRPPHPHGEGAPPLRPRVTFSPMRKSPKNLPEGDTPSGYSPWGALSSPPPRKECHSGQYAIHKLPAAPRIDSRECDSRYSLGKNKDRFAHQPKVANRSIFVAESSPGASVSAAPMRAEIPHQGIPKGAALGAPLVTFPALGKSPGVEGRSALHMGVVGTSGPHLGSAEGQRPSPRGPGCPTHPSVEREKRGARRGNPSQKGYPAIAAASACSRQPVRSRSSC